MARGFTQEKGIDYDKMFSRGQDKFLVYPTILGNNLGPPSPPNGCENNISLWPFAWRNLHGTT
jgi:hypothetical protein